MQASEFIRTLREKGSVRLNNLTLSRPVLNHQDSELMKQPLLVMESMLDGKCEIHAALETRGESQRYQRGAGGEAMIAAVYARKSTDRRIAEERRS